MKWIKKVAETPLTTIARVIDSLNESANDRTNAPSIHAVREGIAAAAGSSMYPIGSIYMSIYDVDPHELFGGTWTRIKDKFLLSAGDTYENGATGGKTSNYYIPEGTVGGHALTVPELPKHIHLYAPYYPADSGVGSDYYNAQSGSGVTIPKVKQNLADQDGWTIENVFYDGTQSPDKTSHAENAEHSHDFTGTAHTFDNLPPYLVVNMWARIA